MWVDAERAPALKDIAAKFTDRDRHRGQARRQGLRRCPRRLHHPGPDRQGPGPDGWPARLGRQARPERRRRSGGARATRKCEFQNSSIKAMTYDGSVYGVPYAIENIALLRNTDLVPEAATTLDEVVAKGKKAVAARQGQVPVPRRAWTRSRATRTTSTRCRPPLGARRSSARRPTAATTRAAPDRQRRRPRSSPRSSAAWGDKGEKIINSNITGDIAKEKFLAGESPYYLTGPWNVPDVQKKGINVRCRRASRPPATSRPAVHRRQRLLHQRQERPTRWPPTSSSPTTSTTEAAQTRAVQGRRPPAGTDGLLREGCKRPGCRRPSAKIGANGVPMPAIPEMGAVWADWGATELDPHQGPGPIPPLTGPRWPPASRARSRVSPRAGS